MIPVYQTRTVANDGAGNCFNACVASILEMPLRDVCQVLPDFTGDYWAEWNRWLAGQGLEIDCIMASEGAPKGFSIATGYGGRFYPEGHARAGKPIMHAAVVFNGELVHDPFPGAKEFGGVRWFWTLNPLCVEEAA